MSDFVNDTFTDTNGTAITSHTGETGATWTHDSGIDFLSGNTCVIDGNTLRRVKWSEDTANSTGETFIYPSGLIPVGCDHFIVEFGFQAVDMAHGADWDSGIGYITVYQAGKANGNPDTRFSIGIGYYGTGTEMNLYDGSTPAFTCGYNTPHVVLLEYNSGTLTATVDGTPTTPQAVSTMTDPISLGFASDGSSTLRIDYLRMYPAGPPAPFWTKYVKSTEVTA